MGNATTAVCAKGLYRHYMGFELNPKMKDIHETNTGNFAVGDFYHPLVESLPTQEELLVKYPHLKKYLNELNSHSFSSGINDLSEKVDEHLYK